MKSEQVVRRRVNTITAHFAAASHHDDISAATATATRVFPMNCSTSLNPVISRCDNRLYFARQGSSSQPCFMRPISTEQGSSDQSGLPLKCTGSAKEPSCNTLEAPLFSKPTSIDPNTSNLGLFKPVVPYCKEFTVDPPVFARTNRLLTEKKQFGSKQAKYACGSNGFQWTPRMDIVESGCNYIVKVELSGVSINDIRVEIHEKTLIVMGSRSTQSQNMGSCSNDAISAYHKREILHGRYKVAWKLPPNVSKRSISAVFVDGILEITIPKL